MGLNGFEEKRNDDSFPVRANADSASKVAAIERALVGYTCVCVLFVGVGFTVCVGRGGKKVAVEVAMNSKTRAPGEATRRMNLWFISGLVDL